MNIVRASEDGVNGARGSFEDSVVCYKVAMIPELMAMGLSLLAGAHAATGPDPLAGLALALPGLAWIGLSP